MKLLIALALLLSFGFVRAQTIVHKPTVLLKIAGGTKPVSFERLIIEKDTSYRLVFRNIGYQELVEVKTMPVQKNQLPAFAKALAAAQASQLKDQTLMDGYSIEKLRTGAVGTLHYWIHYDGGYCQLSEKDIRNLQDVVKKEL